MSRIGAFSRSVCSKCIGSEERRRSDEEAMAGGRLIPAQTVIGSSERSSVGVFQGIAFRSIVWGAFNP